MSVAREMKAGVVTRFIVLVFVPLVFVPLVAAQESYHEFERGLNLSESQRTQADNIKKRYFNQWKTLREESVRRRLELRDLKEERPDQREKAQRLQRELDQIRASRQRSFRQYRGEVSTLFNDEQRSRFDRFTDRENRRPVNPHPYRMHER